MDKIPEDITSSADPCLLFISLIRWHDFPFQAYEFTQMLCPLQSEAKQSKYGQHDDFVCCPSIQLSIRDENLLYCDFCMSILSKLPPGPSQQKQKRT